MHLLSRGSGYPVLFLHGIPTSCQLWTGIIEKMVSKFTCITLDLPGLGRTAETRPGFQDLRKLAATIDDIRIRCGIEKWHVVGHDAGSAIAVHYAQEFPERVERMALMAPSMFPDLKPFFLFEVLRKPIIGELMAPVISVVFWKYAMQSALDWDENLNDAVRAFRAPFVGMRGAWRLMSVMRWGNPAKVLASIPSVLPELRQPTLIFHGSEDPAVPEAFARRAAALIPDSEVVVLDSGHFFPMRESGLVAEELLRFFDSHKALNVQSVAEGAGVGA